MKMPVALTTSIMILQICKTKSESVVTCKLMNLYVPWNCHVGIRLTWKEQRVFQTILEFTLLKLHIITKHFWDAKRDHGQQRNETTSMISHSQMGQHRWACAVWLMHCLSISHKKCQAIPWTLLNRTHPWGITYQGRAGSGKRGQHFMEERKEGRNGQAVNFRQVFAKWRILSAVLFWENEKAESSKFNSCNYGLSYKGDAFLPSK